MPKKDDDNQWYTAPEACEYLRVSNSTLYSYMKDGRLPFFYLAGTRQRRLRRQDLDALLVKGDLQELDAEDDNGA